MKLVQSFKDTSYSKNYWTLLLIAHGIILDRGVQTTLLYFIMQSLMFTLKELMHWLQWIAAKIYRTDCILVMQSQVGSSHTVEAFFNNLVALIMANIKGGFFIFIINGSINSFILIHFSKHSHIIKCSNVRHFLIDISSTKFFNVVFVR